MTEYFDIQSAADTLNMSYAYLTRLLCNGKLPYEDKIVISKSDVEAYKQRRYAEQTELLALISEVGID